MAFILTPTELKEIGEKMSLTVLLCKGLRDTSVYALMYNFEGVADGERFNT